MKVTHQLKHSLANFRFMRTMRTMKRQHRSITFDEARSIGILYNATNERHYETVKQYVKQLRSHHKEVLALGFVDAKQLPAMWYSKLGLDFFTRKDLNWQMIPNNLYIQNFIKGKFDILLMLNIENCFPLKYLAAVTEAKFKIGRYDKKNVDIFDMMISMDEKSTFYQFIQQVNHYLNMMSKEQIQETVTWSK